MCKVLWKGKKRKWMVFGEFNQSLSDESFETYALARHWALTEGLRVASV